MLQIETRAEQRSHSPYFNVTWHIFKGQTVAVYLQRIALSTVPYSNFPSSISRELSNLYFKTTPAPNISMENVENATKKKNTLRLAYTATGLLWTEHHCTL